MYISKTTSAEKPSAMLSGKRKTPKKTPQQPKPSTLNPINLNFARRPKPPPKKKKKKTQQTEETPGKHHLLGRREKGKVASVGEGALGELAPKHGRALGCTLQPQVYVLRA